MTETTNEWQLQEAKNKLSQLVKAAGDGTPQYITVHGKSTAVLLSVREYERLSRPKSTLSEALTMPLFDRDNNSELFERNMDYGRDIDL